MEQNSPPHLQVNPVNPTFFLQTKHRFFFFLPSPLPESPSWLSETLAEESFKTGTVAIVGWAVSKAHAPAGDLSEVDSFSSVFKLEWLLLGAGPSSEKVNELLEGSELCGYICGEQHLILKFLGRYVVENLICDNNEKIMNIHLINILTERCWHICRRGLLLLDKIFVADWTETLISRICVKSTTVFTQCGKVLLNIGVARIHSELK